MGGPEPAHPVGGPVHPVEAEIHTHKSERSGNPVQLQVKQPVVVTEGINREGDNSGKQTVPKSAIKKFALQGKVFIFNFLNHALLILVF